jgi:protein phosphatase PTC2/3
MARQLQSGRIDTLLLYVKMLLSLTTRVFGSLIILCERKPLPHTISPVTTRSKTGHGQGGELVSQFALHEIQRRLEQHPAFSSNVEKAFVDTFLQVNEDLAKEPYIEPLYAGTTACVGLLRDSQFVCANVGDSRAVCARRRYEDNGNHNGSNGEARPHSYEAIQLTIDQNPDLASETARIKEMGGFVSPPPEPGLSARVWLDRECTQIGLAMARSLGDYAVKEIGVIAEPVVTFHTVTNQDEFVVFATDGVWEFISSQEAVDVVANHLAQHNDATKACQALMELAAERWHDEEGDYRDDITALVVRLPLLW